MFGFFFFVTCFVFDETIVDVNQEREGDRDVERDTYISYNHTNCYQSKSVLLHVERVCTFGVCCKGGLKMLNCRTFEHSKKRIFSDRDYILPFYHNQNKHYIMVC